MYDPTAVQFPTDGHDTELAVTVGMAFLSPGSGAVVPADQTPPDSLSRSPGE
jgi:hypothetical protein